MMVPILIYWGAMIVLALWFLWSTIFSIIYLHNKENGNLRFFAIINALALVVGIIIELVFNTWRFGVTLSPWFTILNIAYAVLIILQIALGREPKSIPVP